MAFGREGLFRRIYHRLNGDGFSLYKCTGCGDGPMHIKGDPASSPCDTCGVIAWRELNEKEFVFETDLLDYFASNEDNLIALEETHDGGPQETRRQQEVQELKDYFDDLADSMKATQMEVLREIRRNDRHPYDYEPYLEEQLGESLYSCLQKKTQRALQRAEFLYNMNREDDGFGPSALTMALSYENELFLRVIWPFLDDLLRVRTQNYPAQEGTKEKTKEKLIHNGRVGRLALGTLGWYLKNDPAMRDSAAKRHFDVEAITKEINKVNLLRNDAAHELSFKRIAIDELRRIMLSPDGVLRRLHPTSRTA